MKNLFRVQVGSVTFFALIVILLSGYGYRHTFAAPFPSDQQGRQGAEPVTLPALVYAGEFVGSYGGTMQAVVCTTTHAFAGQGGSLVVFALNAPSTPLASLPVAGLVQDIFLDGSSAYVATGTGGVQVVDVQNPAAPPWLLPSPRQTPPPVWLPVVLWSTSPPPGQLAACWW